MVNRSPLAIRVASLARWRPADDPELLAARVDLAGHQLEQAVRRIMTGSLCLRPDQRARIVALLDGPGTHA